MSSLEMARAGAAGTTLGEGAIAWPAREAATPPKVKARVRPAAALSAATVDRMFQIFAAYYDGISRETFESDLREKDSVILLRESRSGRLVGFSTLLKAEFEVDGRRVRGAYSGDTVLEKAHWGSPALGVAFLFELWKMKARSPFRPLYWFLISKGYKTYLLMANNFASHWPRHEKPTPASIGAIADAFYSSRFGSDYDPTTGLIRPQGASCRLKESVADIDEDLLRRPRVAFFQTRNPGWKSGEELACVAEMTLFMPAKYALKKLFRRFGARRSGGAKGAEASERRAEP